MDKLLYAQTFVAKIRSARECKHEYKLRYAKKAREAIEAFIAEEAHEANSRDQSDPNYLSWAKIGEVLELSRSAAFTRYRMQNRKSLNGDKSDE